MVWTGISLEYCTAVHLFRQDSVTAVRYRDEVLDPTVRLYTPPIPPIILLLLYYSYDSALTDDMNFPSFPLPSSHNINCCDFIKNQDVFGKSRK
ncbi:hypothetical protein CEXT_804551 [Caerostris extrusa]|uniref:Uncharacterized protein n=1 Tax=Caerostris extrusa TaxID=172846 RepID=A0AAV4NX66_CAEEX|nr:hypothetical protein CEXT_804551 [Caerostris extrusa]